jgi:hypothetical protein
MHQVNYHTQEREALMSIINENCKNFSLLNIDAKLVWLLNNENIDILWFKILNFVKIFFKTKVVFYSYIIAQFAI